MIDSSIFGLTILVAGDTTLRSYLENYNSYTPVIQSIDALTIKGASGSATPMLRLGSTSSSVSYNGVSCSWLGVENVDLRIGESGNLPRYGFFTENTSSHGTLRFQNACAEILTMSDGAAATGYSDITLTDCDIVTTGVTVSGGAFVKDGSPTTYVVISNEVYDLYVLGQRLYGGHLEGSFYRYDPQSKTLYLNGSGSYTCSSLPFIENHIDDLTIYVESDIRLTTIDPETNGALIESNREMTIRSAPSGEASLKRLILDGNGTAGGILMDNSAYLFLDEANVFVHSVRYGLLGIGWTGAPLLGIINSYLDVQAAEGWAAVRGFTGGIVLVDCYIYTPYQAKISDGIIYQEDMETYATEVLIVPNSVSYIVSFDMQGHGAAPAAQTIPNGECAREPAAPKESGWIFGGWYTDTECTTPYDFSTPVTGPLTLYAKWTQTGYDLWICDTQVTVLNKDDVLGEGNIRFDPETNVLTVNGTYSYTEAAFIRASMDMTLTGTAQLTGGYDYPVIDLSMNTLTLDGAAELTVTGSDLAAVYTRGLTVDGGSLTVANGSNCAILCDSMILNSGSITATACCTAIRGVSSAKTGTVTVNGGSLYARNTWGPDMYRYSAIDVSMVNCNGGRLEAISEHAESSAIDATSGFTIAETQAVTTPAGGAVNQITSGSSSYYTVTEADGTTPATHVVIEPKPTYIPGDINGDGRVTIADVTLLAKYVKAHGQGVEANADALDVNGDGRVTIADVTLLAKYVKSHGQGVVIH